MGRSRIEEAGNRYGMLTVIRSAGKLSYGQYVWWCRCDCGKVTIVSGKNLRRGNNSSCGCYSHGKAAFNRLYTNYKYQAAFKNLTWALSKRYFKWLTAQNCYYCGAEPANIYEVKNCNGGYTYNGVDRKDNTKGYTKENSVPCCWQCNRIKSDLPLNEFIRWVRRVSNYCVDFQEY